MTRSLYLISTGELTGLSMSADDEMLALNTPPGHAWVAGAHDARRFIVHLVTDDLGVQQPVVAARTPPRPADTAFQVWAWDEALVDWRAQPTLELLKAQARGPVLAGLQALDGKLARPVGEIAQAQALGLDAPSAAVQRLTAVNTDKQALRDRLAAIAAATTVAELQALLDEELTLLT